MSALLRHFPPAVQCTHNVLRAESCGGPTQELRHLMHLLRGCHPSAHGPTHLLVHETREDSLHPSELLPTTTPCVQRACEHLIREDPRRMTHNFKIVLPHTESLAPAVDRRQCLPVV